MYEIKNAMSSQKRMIQRKCPLLQIQHKYPLLQIQCPQLTICKTVNEI